MTGLEHLRTIGVNPDRIMRFVRLGDAIAKSYEQQTIHLVVMGDDERFWVMSARDAAKCRKAGYECI